MRQQIEQSASFLEANEKEILVTSALDYVSKFIGPIHIRQLDHVARRDGSSSRCRLAAGICSATMLLRKRLPAAVSEGCMAARGRLVAEAPSGSFIACPTAICGATLDHLNHPPKCHKRVPTVKRSSSVLLNDLSAGQLAYYHHSRC